MALARVKVWIAGDILTAADLNAEFNNILNNPISLISPTTAAITFTTAQGFPYAQIVATSASLGGVLVGTTAGRFEVTGVGTSGQALIVSSSQPVWSQFPTARIQFGDQEVTSSAPTFMGVWSGSTDENVQAFTYHWMPNAGTVKNLYLSVRRVPTTGGTYVCDVKKNGSTTPISVTVTSSYTLGTAVTDITNSISVAAGDYLSFKFTVNATGGDNPNVSGAIGLYQP